MTDRLRATPTQTLLIAVLLAWGASAAAQTDEPGYGDDYGAGNFGRVRYEENGVQLLRAEAGTRPTGTEAADINAPVFPGDSVETAPDQRLEVQLAQGSLVRVDELTELTFLALPDPYAEFADHTILQLAAGTIRLSATLADDEEFRVDTPSASVYLLGDADVRVETNSRGRTLVLSRRGVCEIVGSGGSVILRAGMQTVVDPDTLPDTPRAVNTFVADAFDRWTDEREAVYVSHLGYSSEREAIYEELPAEVQPHYNELEAHGDWVDTEDYGYVWTPEEVADDWKPYTDGYWGYGPSGYIWISNEPWGWAPYHYGRWNWVGGYGWCWIPGRVFGGAWVSWSWGNAYLGWAPLNYWGYPAFRHAPYYGIYDPWAWTFVSYHHVHHRHYRHYSVPWDHVSHEVRDNAVVTRPPRVRPEELASSPEARTRAVDAARNDRSRRLSRADGDLRSRRALTDVEADLARGSAARTRDIDLTRDAQADRSGRRGDDGVPTRTATAARGSSYPPRISTGTARRSTLTRTTTTGETAGAGVPLVRPRDTGAQQEGIRDLYRKVASPRQTRQPTSSDDERRPATRQGTVRTRPTNRPSGSDSRATPPPRTPTTRRVTPPPPSRSTPSRSAQPSAPTRKPAYRSGSSTPRRTPSRTAQPSSPRPTPSRTARPSSPRPAPSRTARPSSPRPTPSARPSTPRPTPSRATRPSTPRPTPSGSKGTTTRSGGSRKRSG